MKTSLVKLFLVLCVVWSVLASLVGLLLWTGISGLDERKARHEALQILSQAPGGPHEDKLAYVGGLEVLKQRTGLMLLLTSVGLFVASLHGLRKGRKEGGPPAQTGPLEEAG